MKFVTINDVLIDKISGEWGADPKDNKSVKIIRTTNFTNSGKIDFSNISLRKVDQRKVVKKKLITGDIIIEKSGGSPKQPVGRVVYFENPDDSIYLCNNFTSILRPNRALVFPKYLFYILFYNHLSQKTIRFQNKTVGLINLQLENYLKSKIYLPTLDDQIRIASILEKAQILIVKRKNSIKMLNELMKSIFYEMFGDIKSKKSIYPWRKPRPYLYAQSGKSSKEIISTTDTGIPIYGGNGINGWATKPLFVEPIIIAGRVGQQCGVIHVSEGPCWVTDNAIVLQIKDASIFNLTYLAHAYRHSPILDKVKQLDLPFINQSMLLDIQIPIPEINSQLRFANIAKKIEIIKLKYQKSLFDLENLYNSLSQLAFKGELKLNNVTKNYEIVIQETDYTTELPEIAYQTLKKYSKRDLMNSIRARNASTFSFDELWTEIEQIVNKEKPTKDDVQNYIIDFLEEENPRVEQVFDMLTSDSNNNNAERQIAFRGKL